MDRSMNGPMRLNPVTEALLAHLRATGQVAAPEVPLGSVQSNPSTPRADVVALRKSWHVAITIYEVKRSLSDFRSDVERGKYRTYLPFCNRLLFAAPTGVIPREELPSSAGLITWHKDRGWHVQKAAPVRQVDPERLQTVLLSLLFRGHDDTIRVRALRERVVWDENARLATRARRLGYDIARRLASPDAAWEAARRAKAELEKILGPTDSFEALVWRAQSWVSQWGKMERVEGYQDLLAACQRWFAGGPASDLAAVVDKTVRP